MLPKGNYLIDLHLHIDGAISVDTAYLLAEMQKITLPTYDRELLKQRLTAPADCKDLNEYLERFDLPCSLMMTQETISEAVYRVQEELKEKGIIYAELRFAPQLHTACGLSQEEVLRAAIDGLNRSDLKANLILCCMRSDNNKQENLETIRLAYKYRKKGVVAIDLAGAEALFPTSTFRKIFAYAKELGLKFTIHSGEADGAHSVKQALEFGASRIGHGINSIEDDEVIQILKEKQIPLEVCISSNLQTKVRPTLQEYPLKDLINQGVIITLNTDNPTVSNTSMQEELELAQKYFNFSNEETKQFLLNSAIYSFADDDTKQYLINKINHAFLSQ